MPIGVSHVIHVNVNCSDLERSLGFYRDLVGLQAGTHTAPTAPQPGGAFGLEQAQWDAWIMHDGRGFGGVVVDLLEWQVPRPEGAPYADAAHLGFGRLGFTTTDLDGLYARLVAAGVDTTGEPHAIGVGGIEGLRAFVGADPDGTLVEFVSGDNDKLAFMAVNCRDLDRSLEFYTEVLGFRSRARFAPGPQDGAALRLGPEVEWEMAYVDDPRGTGEFALDLVEWKHPPSAGPAYESANHVGIYRMALSTDDIDRDYDALRTHGVEPVSPPALLQMGPGIPELRALLFPDPDGAMLELIQPPIP